MNVAGLIKRMVPRVAKEALKRQFADAMVRDGSSKECFGQFGEDICIQNFFAAKAGRESGTYSNYSGAPAGFYVDVGAYHPELNSNTYWFYKHGWRGINIDVRIETKALFDEERPRDINVEAVVSDEERVMTLHAWPGRPEMTTLSAERARELSEHMGEPERRQVRTSTLADILAAHLPSGQPISFLSVDAEGHDLSVLRSNDWKKYRPDLVVVEDHEARIEKIVESPISAFMATTGYRIAYWIQPSIIYVQV